MTGTKSHPVPTRADHGPGLIPPAELWGRVLATGPLVPDAVLPFEERVERAWRRLTAGFHEDEHERLREVLGQKIERERCGKKAR
jgi:hypothetical protein